MGFFFSSLFLLFFGFRRLRHPGDSPSDEKGAAAKISPGWEEDRQASYNLEPVFKCSRSLSGHQLAALLGSGISYRTQRNKLVFLFFSVS